MTAALGRLVKTRSWGCWSCQRISSLSYNAAAIEKQRLREIEDVQNVNFPFARSKVGTFFQTKPTLGNQFLEDVTLKSYLQRVMPSEVYNALEGDLTRFGARVAGELYDLHLECERNPPRLQTYDAWGERVDNIIISEAWKKMKTVSAEEGLIATAYENKYGEYDRLYQMVKLYLFSPSSGLYSCPLAMTDGAAKCIISKGLPGELRNAYNSLTSRNPDQFWTSGQWMTERRGGSDVSGGTETLAMPQADGSYRLFGYKWFTSATDSDMTMTLARIVDEEGRVVEGSRGLTMFYAELKDSQGRLNNIEVQRLKDKLGTRQLPTAELLLDGMVAHKFSEEGRGVASISDMLTLTRIHNSLSSASAMRRIVNFARDYSWKRFAFGKIIKEHGVHVKNLANMEVETRAALLLVLEVIRLLGREEAGIATAEESNILRIMTPLIKLYTAKQAMSVVSEGLECFGGMGYLEDTGLPGILRDAQVLPIWEGTTNILSLDVLRAIAKSKGATLVCLLQEIENKVARIDSNSDLAESALKVANAAKQLLQYASEHADTLELAARDFAFSLSRTVAAGLLIEHASGCGCRPQDVLAAQRWCQKDLTPVITEAKLKNYSNKVSENEFSLIMDGYQPAN